MKPKFTRKHQLTWTGKPGSVGHISNSNVDSVAQKIYYEIHFADGETACAEESELSIMNEAPKAVKVEATANTTEHTPYPQGSRVANADLTRIGVVLEVQGDVRRVGWDDGEGREGYTDNPITELKPALSSPPVAELPVRQREFLMDVRNKKPVVKNAATRDALRRHGYINRDDAWGKVKLTPYGIHAVQAWVKAGMPFGTPEEDPYLEPDIDDSIAATEPSYVGDGFTEEYAEDRDEFGDTYPPVEPDETITLIPDLIERHTNHKLVIPDQERPGDNLFFEQGIAKQLEELKAALAEANLREQALQVQLVEEQKTVFKWREGVRIKNDELAELNIKNSSLARWHDEDIKTIADLKKTVERQQQELEALKDAKVNAAINGKPNARAYVTKTLVQHVDPDTYGELMSPLNIADDELMAHVSTGWRVVHEEINSVFDPRADRIIHTRIVRVEQRPTPERTRRAEAKAEATPDPAEQIIFEAGEIVETAFSFEEALKSGKFSANEMARIGDAEVMATMKRTYEAQTSTRPFTPLPLFGSPSIPVSQIIMEVSQDE